MMITITRKTDSIGMPAIEEAATALYSLADAGNRLAVGGQQRQTAHSRHRAECHNKRGQIADGNADTVYHADSQTGQHRNNERHDERQVALPEQLRPECR